MIKFFRKIRRNLLSQGNTGKPANRTGRYLKYAIGEIFLVAIGILIALQINNANEARKIRNKEFVPLSQMKDNLESDLRDLEYNIKHNKERTHSNEIIRTVIEQKLPYHDTLDPHFGNFFGNFQLSENTSAWENLKSVGLDLVSNDSLRNNLSNLYSNKYAYLENLEKGLDDRYQWFYLYPQVLEHISMEKLWVSGKPRDYDLWINDNEFYEILKMNIEWRHYMQDQYEQNYKAVVELEAQIDRHLESLNK